MPEDTVFTDPVVGADEVFTDPVVDSADTFTDPVVDTGDVFTDPVVEDGTPKRPDLKQRLVRKQDLIDKLTFLQKQTPDDVPDENGLTLQQRRMAVESSGFNDAPEETIAPIAESVEKRYAEAARSQGLGEVAAGALRRGYESTGAMTLAGARALKPGAMTPEEADLVRAGQQASQEFATAEAPRAVGSVRDIGGAGDALKYATETILENAPRAIPAIGGATIGGIVGGPVGAAAGLKAGVGAGIGAGVGSALTGLAQNVGEATFDQAQEGRTIDKRYAIAQGAGYSLVDGLIGGETSVIAKAMARRAATPVVAAMKKSFVSTVGGAVKSAMKTGVGEGVAEAVQSGVVGRAVRKAQTGSALAPNETPQDVATAALDEFVGGFLAGTAMGGVESSTALRRNQRFMARADEVLGRMSSDPKVQHLKGADKVLARDYMLELAALPESRTAQEAEARRQRMDDILNGVDGETFDTLMAYRNLFTENSIVQVPKDVAPTFAATAQQVEAGWVDEGNGVNIFADKPSGILVSEKNGEYSVSNNNGLKMPLDKSTFATLDEAVAFASDLSRLNQFRVKNNEAKARFITSLAKKTHPNAKVVMVDSADQVDASVRQLMQGGEQAFYNPADNTVYAILDTIQNPAQAAIVMQHENFHNSFESWLKATGQTREQVLGTSDKATQEQVEEDMAKAYEKRTSEPTKWQMKKLAIGNWLKSVTGVDIRPTDADMRVLLNEVAAHRKTMPAAPEATYDAEKASKANVQRVKAAEAPVAKTLEEQAQAFDDAAARTQRAPATPTVAPVAPEAPVATETDKNVLAIPPVEATPVTPPVAPKTKAFGKKTKQVGADVTAKGKPEVVETAPVVNQTPASEAAKVDTARPVETQATPKRKKNPNEYGGGKFEDLDSDELRFLGNTDNVDTTGLTFKWRQLGDQRAVLEIDKDGVYIGRAVERQWTELLKGARFQNAQGKDVDSFATIVNGPIATTPTESTATVTPAQQPEQGLQTPTTQPITTPTPVIAKTPSVPTRKAFAKKPAPVAVVPKVAPKIDTSAERVQTVTPSTRSARVVENKMNDVRQLAALAKQRGKATDDKSVVDAVALLDETLYRRYSQDDKTLQSLRDRYAAEVKAATDGRVSLSYPAVGSSLDKATQRQSVENGQGIVTEVQSGIVRNGKGDVVQKATVATGSPKASANATLVAEAAEQVPQTPVRTPVEAGVMTKAEYDAVAQTPAWGLVQSRADALADAATLAPSDDRTIRIRDAVFGLDEAIADAYADDAATAAKVRAYAESEYAPLVADAVRFAWPKIGDAFDAKTQKTKGVSDGFVNNVRSANVTTASGATLQRADVDVTQTKEVQNAVGERVQSEVGKSEYPNAPQGGEVAVAGGGNRNGLEAQGGTAQGEVAPVARKAFAPKVKSETQVDAPLSEPGTVVPWKRKLSKDASMYERTRTKSVKLTPELSVHEFYMGTVIDDLKTLPKENIWTFADKNASVLARHMDTINARRGIGTISYTSASRMLEDAYSSKVDSVIEQRGDIPVANLDDWEDGVKRVVDAGYVREGDRYVYRPDADAAPARPADARFRRVTPQQDAEYMQAVNAGDMATADIRFRVAPQTDTPEFAKWFGDSKVVDADGKPLVVYHGTGNTRGQYGVFVRGDAGYIYVTPSTEYVNRYSGERGVVYPLYASVQRPLDLREYGVNVVTKDQVIDILNRQGVDGEKAVGGWADQAPKPLWRWIKGSNFKDAIVDAGFDAVWQRESYGSKNDYEALALFEPTQLKSAIANVGTFDPTNPDIRFRRPDTPTADFQRDIRDAGLSDRYVQVPKAEDDASRRAQIIRNAVYADGLDREAREPLRQRAAAELASSRNKMLLDAADGAFSTSRPLDTARLVEAMNESMLDAVRPDASIETMDLADEVNLQGQMNFTQLGRSLAFLRDKFNTPTGRRAELARLLTLPDDVAAEKLRVAKTLSERKAIRRPLLKRAKQRLAQLAKVDIVDDKGNKVKFDVNALTPEQLMNDTLFKDAIAKIRQNRATTGDKLYEFWQNGILSGPVTLLVVNPVGNIANIALEVGPQRQAEILIGKVLGSRDAPTEASTAAGFRYANAAMPDVRENFKQTLRTEQAQLGEYADKWDTGGQAIGKTLFGLDLGFDVGKAVRTPRNFLSATDQGFRTWLMNFHIADLATRKFDNLLKDGTDGVTEDMRDDFIAEAMKDDSDIYAEAKTIADRQLFQNKPGVIGQLFLGARRSENPIAKWMSRYLFPFITTPANVIKSGARKTPLGSIPLLWQYGTGKFGGSEAAKAEGVRLAAEQAVGWAIMGAIGLLMQGDDDDPLGRPRITGTQQSVGRFRPGEAEFEKRNEPQMSVRIGDSWYSYRRIEPLATIMATVVDILHAGQYVKSGDLSKAGERMAKSLVGMFSDRTYLKTVGDVISAVRDNDPGSYMKLVTGTAAGFVPNIAKTTMRGFDPVIRDIRNRAPKGTLDWWVTGAQRFAQSALPSPAIQPMPIARYDVAGRPVTKEGQGGFGVVERILSPFSRQSATNLSRVDAMLKRYADATGEGNVLPAPPQMPDIKPFGAKKPVPLTDAEFAEYQQLAGETATRRLASMRFNFDAPTELDVKRVRKVYELSRDFAKRRITPQVLRRVAQEKRQA